MSMSNGNQNASTAGKCPSHQGGHDQSARAGTNNRDQWPNQPRVDLLNQHSNRSNPLGEDFDYRKELSKLDYSALKGDLRTLLSGSQPWRPADWETYAGLFIRIARHGVGTYHSIDGHGSVGRGQQRLAPLNSWPDNVSLGKTCRPLWPVKQKHGQRTPQADLLTLAGDVTLGNFGFRTSGLGAGREDVWEPDLDANRSDEEAQLTHHRPKKLARVPSGAVEMGLIYINPEEPDRSGEPLSTTAVIRATSGNTSMNDEGTVALIGGGHTLDRARGATPASYVEADPESAPIEAQGLGWAGSYGGDAGADVIISGLEVMWTRTSTQWSNHFFENPFKYEWVQTRSSAGAIQLEAADAPEIIPDPSDLSKKRKPMMLVTDLTLRFDSEFEKIPRRFLSGPQAFSEALACAWFKLMHRDMGPKLRYVGPEVSKEDPIWQDPLPHTFFNPSEKDILKLKATVVVSGLFVGELVSAAWASASTFYGGDKRGGTNGVRLVLDPQCGWDVDATAAHVLPVLGGIYKSAHTALLTDIIVLAGVTGIEQVASVVDVSIEVPFASGRVDVRQNQMDIETFELLEPIADGFRNYCSRPDTPTTESLLIDKTQQLTLTIPEMTALVGGMRILGASFDGSQHGVLTDRPGVPSIDFFVNLLDVHHEWKTVDELKELFEGCGRLSGEVEYTATRADLVSGSGPVLCIVAEVHTCSDAHEEFIRDFVSAWVKVMDLDHFDLL